MPLPPMGSPDARLHPLAAYYQDILPRRPCDPLADDLLRQLLALIHRDGGQDAARDGLAQSCCRAELTIRQLRLDAEAVRERRNDPLDELTKLVNLAAVS